MMNYIKRVMNPAWYHGHGKKPPFFEGWYFKLLNADETQRWAIIPGVFINEDVDKTHAFIQVLNGTTGKANYHQYPIEAFEATSNAFNLCIGKSHFLADKIELHIDDNSGSLKGRLHFSNLHPWPVKFWSPGIMGPFGWLNFLECYHGVVSLDHHIEGTLQIDGENIDFSDGRGYTEKDWGKSFPRGYIWQQSNHFETAGTSLTASIAVIPNLGISFPGFIVGLWHEQQLFQFTTYNNSKVHHLHVTDDTVEWILRNKQYERIMVADRAEAGILKGPEREAMIKRVDETMQATIEVTLNRLQGSNKQLIFEGCGRNAGLEVVGDLGMILKP